MLERVGIWCVARLLRLVGATLRWRVIGDERIREGLRSGRGVVLYGWHEGLLAGAPVLAPYRPAIMISRSRDGNRIARVVEQFGWDPVRGSSSRGGAIALRGLLRELRRGRLVGHVVDGPGGPAHRVKPGLVALGRMSGAPLLPVAFALGWAWRAPSWDRLWVPLPFSRAVLLVGEPEFVPRDLDEEGAEALRERLEAGLEALFDRTRAEIVV